MFDVLLRYCYFIQTLKICMLCVLFSFHCIVPIQLLMSFISLIGAIMGTISRIVFQAVHEFSVCSASQTDDSQEVEYILVEEIVFDSLRHV